MKKLILFFAVTCFLNNGVLAQVKESPPPIIEEVEEFSIEEPPPPMQAPRNIDSEYTRNKNTRYATSRIIDGYELFYDKKQEGYYKEYGILKKGDILLPRVFRTNTYSASGKTELILGLGGKFGVFNLMTEDWQIPVQYTALSLLEKNIYRAQKGGYGLIDANNNELLAFKYSEIGTISGMENYVRVLDKTGGVNRFGVYSILSGKFIIEPKYMQIEKIKSRNAFIIKESEFRYNIVDAKDRVQFETWYDRIITAKEPGIYIVKKADKMGIIDEKGKVIVPIEYRKINERPYNDGSYLAIDKDGKYGCMTLKGEVTLPFEYDRMDIKGYNSVAISSKKNKCGLIQINNGTPVEIATCDYDDIIQDNKLFIVEQGKKYGVMDIYGKLITKLEYDEIQTLKGGFMTARKKSNWYFLSNEGQVLTDKGYAGIFPVVNAANSYSYGNYANYTYLSIKGKDGKFGLIDKLGNEILPVSFEEISAEAQNTLITKKNGKFGLYNLLSKQSTLPNEYDQIVFSNNRFYGFKGKDVYMITNYGKINVKKL